VFFKNLTLHLKARYKKPLHKKAKQKPKIRLPLFELA
jgi:hypothetical protein